jgi:ketosteroid isomerase-like protein
MQPKSVFAGAALAITARALLPHLLRVKFVRDVRQLNAGNHSTLLAAYADDAVYASTRATTAGRGTGSAAGDRPLPENFTAAKVQGEIKQIAVAGPPWALTMLVRFDDHVDGPNGTRLYENRTVLVLRTKWGKIVDHEDFYVDTAAIESSTTLTELGVEPVPKSGYRPTCAPPPTRRACRPGDGARAHPAGDVDVGGVVFGATVRIRTLRLVAAR